MKTLDVRQRLGQDLGFEGGRADLDRDGFHRTLRVAAIVLEGARIEYERRCANE
jgi:hypothetical protein